MTPRLAGEPTSDLITARPVRGLPRRPAHIEGTPRPPGRPRWSPAPQSLDQPRRFSAAVTVALITPHRELAIEWHPNMRAHVLTGAYRSY